MRLGSGLMVLTMILAPALAWGQTEALRFSASSSWGMPYGNVRDDQLVGGIVYDLSHAIGTALNVPVQHVVLPRKRLEAAAQAGEIDVRCYFNPSWTPNPSQYIFSVPLFDASDVLVGAAGKSSVSGVAQLPQGAMVGTVLGYVYPSIKKHFADESLLRDDAIDQEKVLKKLSRGRNNYSIVNTRVLAWFKRQSGSTGIAEWSLPIERADFYCGVMKNAAHNVQKVVDAINRLKSTGQIDKILQNYQ